MAIKRYKKQTDNKNSFSKEELTALIRMWLDKHEADLVADFRPSEPLWRKLLAIRLAEDLFNTLKHS